MTPRLSPNALAFIALCNEYCAAMEHAATAAPVDFARTMLRLLPRIYISASDIRDLGPDIDSIYIEPAMDEDTYEAIRSAIAALLGEHDTYLEVFEQDMKYSDTPIAATISEGLTDIMQPLYNFVELAKDAPVELIEEALALVADDFRNYWGAILCNQLRALHALVYSGALDDESYQ